MPGNHLGPRRSPVTAIEALERIRNRIAGKRFVALNQLPTHSVCTDVAALNVEIGKFFAAIQQSQIQGKFQAVDDARRLLKADVLGPQITMGFHDGSAGGALCQIARNPLKTIPLQAHQTPDRSGRQTKLGIEQGGVVGLHLSPNAGNVGVRRERYGRLLPIEVVEAAGDGADRSLGHAPRSHDPVEHQFLRQASHPDQPVERGALPFNVQRSAVVRSQFHYAQIDVRSQSPVQPHFLATGVLTARHLGQVETGYADRFLQLVSVRFRQKHPGEMGFHGGNGPHPIRIALRLLQHTNFFRQFSIRTHGNGLRGSGNCGLRTDAVHWRRVRLQEAPSMSIRFTDRVAAGRRLARELRDFRSAPDCLVLGLPRGGVPVAAAVAQDLELPLDVLVVRKIGAPEQPEFAFGAIASGGVTIVNEEVPRGVMGSPELQQIVSREWRELKRSEQAYRLARDPLRLDDQTVILVDDGAATGSTMLAAVQAARQLGARRIIAALPVASPEAVARIESEADRVMCISVPTDFIAVGRWYRDFPQITDTEVRDLLVRAIA